MIIYLKSIIVLFLAPLTSAVPIVFGFGKATEPDLGKFPFQASLMQLMPDNKTYHSFCGGSLIHTQWVLTAAHCIRLDASEPAMKPSQVYIALGSILRNADRAQILRAQHMTIHPTYLTTNRNDIGLIKLTTGAKLGKNVNLITLHTNNNDDLIGKTAFLTGFGIIDDLYNTPTRLRMATLHINSYNNCYSEKQNQNTEICATSTIHEGKACKGDSGGPLTILEKGKYIQIGITSHLAILPICRISFNHSVYTRVSAFLAWITKVTGIHFATLNSNQHTGRK